MGLRRIQYRMHLRVLMVLSTIQCMAMVLLIANATRALAQSAKKQDVTAGYIHLLEKALNSTDYEFLRLSALQSIEVELNSPIPTISNPFFGRRENTAVKVLWEKADQILSAGSVNEESLKRWLPDILGDQSQQPQRQRQDADTTRILDWELQFVKLPTGGIGRIKQHFAKVDYYAGCEWGSEEQRRVESWAWQSAFRCQYPGLCGERRINTAVGPP